MGETGGRCRCGHWDLAHFDEVKACDSCPCAAFQRARYDDEGATL